MDIVYLVKVDPENNSEELRYSLRSLKNLPHDRVFIVGEKPDWATNVEYIPVAQSKTKSENVSMNLSAAVRNEKISNDFVMMNDDFFIMKPIPEMPTLHFGSMQRVIDMYDVRYPEGSDYISKMKQLHDVLVAKGYDTPVSYELHVPMVLRRRNVQQLYVDAAGEPLYQFRTYYGNRFAVGGVSIKDVKIFLDNQHNEPEYNQDPERYLEQQTFLSATGGSFKRGLVGDFVRSSLPEKSMYEL